jgi:hypothetical protein
LTSSGRKPPSCSGAGWGRLHRGLGRGGSLAEAAEPQPEPQRDLDSYGRSRMSPEAAPLATCANGTQANFHGREEVIWGSRGRRFKSCQPDSEIAGQRPDRPTGMVRPLWFCSSVCSSGSPGGLRRSPCVRPALERLTDPCAVLWWRDGMAPPRRPPYGPAPRVAAPATAADGGLHGQEDRRRLRHLRQ